MTAGMWPRLDRVRLLAISDHPVDHWFDDLPELLGEGDLLVVNDAATLPASLRNDTVELRLLAFDGEHWRAVLFGAGDWRTPTEDRPAPPDVDVIELDGLTAHIVDRDPRSPRLVTLRFDQEGQALWDALYRHGRPVQYSYLPDDLPLRAVQTPYASRPWAVEMPSAGRPLGWKVLRRLKQRGVKVASLTHAAGLSSTGDPALDALLPLPEAYDLPLATVDAIREARRVIAVGTSVVRALEGSFAEHGQLVSGAGVTDLIVEPDTELHVVDGLLSGMHEPGESHFRMHLAFADRQVLLDAYEHAVRTGYRNHEFGDSTLILR